MGVPDWSRGDFKKSSSAPAKPGIKSMGSLFHGKAAPKTAPKPAKQTLFAADGTEGGVDEAVMKQEGLKASANEDVGLKRLFMGSIDDPQSEAYHRFGAGRGRAERWLKEDAIRTDDRDDGLSTPTAPHAQDTGEGRSEAAVNAVEMEKNHRQDPRLFMDSTPASKPTRSASVTKKAYADTSRGKDVAPKGVFYRDDDSYNTAESRRLSNLKNDSTPAAKSSKPSESNANPYVDSRGRATGARVAGDDESVMSRTVLPAVKRLFSAGDNASAKAYLSGKMARGETLTPVEEARAKQIGLK